MRKLFLIVSMVAVHWAGAQSPIDRIEYFFNTDPGMGNATAASFSSATTVADLNFPVNTTGLQPGINRLYIRSRASNGRWSQTATSLFYRLTTLNAPANIDRIEYFFNSDPGFGAGIPVSFGQSTNLNSLGFTPDITGLPQGINRLYIRSRDANGKWSQVANNMFYKLNTLPAASQVTSIEYFFNVDPGFGAATPVPFSAASNISDLSFTPNTTTLQDGLNRLYVRSKDVNGKWSQVANNLFYKLSPPPAAANITKVEYFFNGDPGLGSGTQVAIAPGTNLGDLGFTPDVTNLSEGLNRFYVRSCDANGKWSQVANNLFYKLSPKVSVTPITKMEYFIGTDPGIGNAVPLVFNTAGSIADFAFHANIAGLSAGQHFLHIRSRDSLGKWSLTAIDTVEISVPAAPQAIVVNSLLINPTNNPLGGGSEAVAAVLCAGKDIRLAFDPSGSYNPGNVFTIQLSNENGAFTSPFDIGQVNGTKGAATVCRLPRHLVPGSNYKIRVVSGTPGITGDPSFDDLVINDINLGADTTIYHACVGETSNLLPLYNTTGLTAHWSTATPATVLPGVYSLVANDATNCPDTALAIIKLEVATWTGTISTNWHEAGNWNIGKVPTNKTHVIINGGTPNNCIISTANAQAASIQVRNGATVNTINNRLAEIDGKCAALPPN
ncbi:MAG: hypothetical protein V4722_24770 [Bacteroidota bacterium]